MPHLAALLLLAAGTALPGVTTRAPSALQISLVESVEEPACPGTLQPAAWADPSSGWFFATGPTARLDAQELHAGTIASLVDLRFVQGALRLFVLGSPMRSGLQFTTAGWRPRWPFC